ncbi:KINETOCHORE PROTEIN SPC24 HOMOLOG-RELATED [Salix purpurea]|uniref:KINETOCHORE PROTEIN SPC24 HOMOLOG-RELATED n=1 Tax=Salix purpurea TaxID=77065 RepID=A0A9Q0VXV2_SALPP|nr:KINETOCHORE PROTEIN SPC24 HOMOLOG-RELATED [Salix purpurea]
MGDSSGKIDVEKLISFSDDLIEVLKDERDINNLTHCLQQSHSLKSSCDAEFNDSKTLIEDYEKKIEECKKKTEKAKAEVVSDGDMEILEQELEAELRKEAALMEELR